ncbi:MAG: type IV toxin-antitoxin system AbiEi family antitoxin domain-containing protein [Oscillospiraceae bacterium]|nr:type IV toxin-antitoxin system AbiEi family antitoxin domain-containing protein [Oscillospiraceae bacterium]
MKHYEKLLELGCFSRSELSQLLGNSATAATAIRNYLNKGYIERVRHDLYAVISLETKQPVCSRYQIGAALFADACICQHSAFEVYGIANQVFYEVYVATESRFSDFTYNGVSYHRIAAKLGTQTESFGKMRVTSLEQTVIDSISNFEKVGGLEETLRCISLIPSLNETKLVQALEQYGNGFLYQKTGYILQQLNETIRISDSFFDICRSHSASCKRYLLKEHDGLIYNREWRLYVPVSLERIVRKGMTDLSTM